MHELAHNRFIIIGTVADGMRYRIYDITGSHATIARQGITHAINDTIHHTCIRSHDGRHALIHYPEHCYSLIDVRCLDVRLAIEFKSTCVDRVFAGLYMIPIIPIMSDNAFYVFSYHANRIVKVEFFSNEITDIEVPIGKTIKNRENVRFPVDQIFIRPKTRQLMVFTTERYQNDSIGVIIFSISGDRINNYETAKIGLTGIGNAYSHKIHVGSRYLIVAYNTSRSRSVLAYICTQSWKVAGSPMTVETSTVSYNPWPVPCMVRIRHMTIVVYQVDKTADGSFDWKCYVANKLRFYAINIRSRVDFAGSGMHMCNTTTLANVMTVMLNTKKHRNRVETIRFEFK